MASGETQGGGEGRRRRRRRRVLIIGAGASGLQAAHSLLTAHGYEDIILLEARNRVGGRIYTWQPPRRGGAQEGFPEYLDLGAAWVHGTEPLLHDDAGGGTPNPMMKYLDKEQDLIEIMPGCGWMRPGTVLHQGLRGGSRDDDDDDDGNADKNEAEARQESPKRLLYVYHDGERLDKDEILVQKALARHFELMKKHVPQKARRMFHQGLGLQTTLVSLQEAVDEFRNDMPQDVDERVNVLSRFYQHLVITWYGKSASQLQLANFANNDDEEKEKGDDTSPAAPDWMYEEEGDFRGPHCLVHGGMQRVLRSMLDKVRDKVELGQEVEELWQEGTNVFAKTMSGTVYEGDACILTIPINCLREDMDRLFQKTSISEEKKEAIQHLSMGRYKKVLLVFDRIFWPADPPFIGLTRTPVDGADNALGDSLVIDNLWARGGLPCFEAILVGDAGEWATHRPDTEIQQRVLDFVQNSFQIDPTELSSWCIACHITRWEEDLYSRGAYASLSLGALPRHVSAMQESEWAGALVFAGDATIDGFEGSVHAALLSGENAANNISDFLAKKAE